VGAETVLAKKFFRFAMVTINQTGRSIDLDRFDLAAAQIAARNGTPTPVRFRTAIGGTPMACTQQENVDTAYQETDCLSTDGIQLYYVGDLDTITTLRAVVEGAQKLSAHPKLRPTRAGLESLKPVRRGLVGLRGEHCI
jgi:hypothetical protein